jgi:ribosomal-protein-alanine N-acetyltransferase
MLLELNRGLTFPHLILDGDRIIGRVTLSNVVRGPLQSCNIGYWVSRADNGRGHATAAVTEMARIAFGELGLHRLQAGTMPTNLASQRVLEHNGFTRIGLAPAYLRIAGRWQDHILFQKIAEGG